MRPLTSFWVMVLCFCSTAWPDEGHKHALTSEELGSVNFQTACSNSVEAKFNRGVALLHSFQYEQARETFSEITKQDPQCAMAQWGVAMSYYHGLWDNGDAVAGKAAIEQAGGIAASNPKTTAREKAYIDALAEIYSDDGKDKAAQGKAFEQKMEALHAAYPADSEAAIFHALALDITAPKTDKTFANQHKCGEILEPIFKKYPHHPGVAHYIIHCYDNPVLAERGLGAARMYASIAPASAHANHMPSHLFTRVGLWDDSINSNIKSAVLATKAEATSKNGEARDQRIHAMDYLEYAYLQSGRLKQAKQVVDEMSALPPLEGITLTGTYGLAAVPARYAIETRNWEVASALKVREDAVPWAQAITWAAIGVGSARSGKFDRATEAERVLSSLRETTTKQNNTYWANQVEVQRREVAAWIAAKSGKNTDAIKGMREAAELEESMDKHAVTPGAITPAREMLAELLLAEHPAEALSEFEAVLKIAPRRFNALYGAATAAEAAGNAAAANQYFRKLTECAVGDERPELVMARKKIGVMAQKETASRP
ncbi:MAG TPA: tetratricopeptide repeat protein [Candidatus Dormibacteraeota bacterium]|nr:tetratricopeptide repeat protein [Candidatus Dormibacteraeota bacterium]